ncbi:MAG: NADH-quinone oxidoreductase subunit A [Armatimonadetes bacterium]|nr:NADH-quinone oxidoreductase subunit A [Armatimonadota bacterium]MDW8028972.1 NADH-quinone oxidoreductase subunit A [Armatimonadota bacterium]
MLTNYIPVAIAILIALGIAAGMLLLSHILGLIEARPKKGKLAAYECGNEPIGDARQRFPVKFYAIAMLFIVFDIEVVFFYPWALVRHDLGMLGFWAMVIFLGILAVGYIYLLRTGAFEWEWWEREQTFEPEKELIAVRETKEVEAQTLQAEVVPIGGERQ